ncbi:hypothetical protein E3N88_01230 [Mikania micrantha]|uniref:Uncharacterized protein n=1 Tax=Mikania micrantha TaxID=192012 RepID=A0A5N6Q0E1_9ASTR|nr:hypothetical protein E3N88_01230 [Mikania micrantha]
MEQIFSLHRVPRRKFDSSIALTSSYSTLIVHVACNCHRKDVEAQQHRLENQFITTLPNYHHHHYRPAGYLEITPALYYHHQCPPMSLPSTSPEDLEQTSRIPTNDTGGVFPPPTAVTISAVHISRGFGRYLKPIT